ncbi:MAG: AAA family ATPase [Pseudomonadota bacterium]
MILEGNERGFGAELARHLMNARDNDHVTVHTVRGFVAEDLHGAFAEAEAISRGTKCQKYLFSMSLNPPPSESVSVDQFEAAIAQTEAKLGLAGQPRAVVFHEKDGRRHAHAVWSRIDAERMTAINLSHYKRKLTALSHDLYLEHGWRMPDGLRDHAQRDPSNTSRQETQQAKRLGRDRAETKAMFRACWEGSDSRAAFAAALKDQGFLLARGERRGFVAVDGDGKVWSLSRWCGVKPREMRARLGPEAELPSVDDLADRTLDLPKHEKKQPDSQADFQRAELVARQRKAREELIQHQERRRLEEAKARKLGAVRLAFLRMTGRAAKIEAESKAAAHAAEQRDREEQQLLIDRHLAERRALDQAQAPKRDPRQKLVVSQDKGAFTARELERDPSLTLTELSKTKAQFTRTDVLRTLAKRIDDPKHLSALADRALTSPEAVRLSSDRVSRYTTQDYQKAENELAVAAKEMTRMRGFQVAEDHILVATRTQNAKLQKAFGGQMSREQQRALRHVLGEHQMASVVGLAGAGKSTMLTAASDAWTRQGAKVHGAALAGKAADGLESASGIQSRTLASLELAWENGRTPIAKGDVLVVDEAGMIGTRQMARLAEKMRSIEAKLVLVGDPDQLQPIEAGTPFRDLVDRHGAAELRDIYRQRQNWQRQASRHLAEGRTAEALQTYANNGAVARSDDRASAIEAMAETYVMDSVANPQATRLAFAHRRKDVHDLNVAIRSAIRDDPENDVLLDTATGPRAIGTGDRLVFGQNDKTLGVKNGMLGRVESVGVGQMMVVLDGDEKRKVSFNPDQYRHFDHGYAVTVHKSQGATVDQSYVLTSRSMDQHLAYVAMTRHRDDLRVFNAAEDQPAWAREQAQTRRLSHNRDGPSIAPSMA